MRATLLILTILSFVALYAAEDARFNGRWDISARRDTHNAWWLEITGAGTNHPAGKFVGYGGNVRSIQEPSITPGEITFGFDHPGLPENALWPPPLAHANGP